MSDIPVPTDTPEPLGPAIEVSRLVKRYGDHTAVDGISFEVRKGDFFAFLGPNGAGKTTSIHAITGLLSPSQGVIRIFGADVVQDFRQARRHLGLSPQEFNFDRYLTIEEILTFQAGYFGVPMHEAKPRAKQLLSQFELWEYRDRDFLKLSGGMKRRLSLARALIHAPKVLILDEPTAGVDLELRLELWDFLKALNRQGMTIVLTTHYLEEAEQLCNRVAIINAGRLVALEDTEALLKHGGGAITLQFEQPLGDLPSALDGLRVEREGHQLVIRQLDVSGLPGILRSLDRHGYTLRDLQIERRSLQDVFLELTGKTA